MRTGVATYKRILLFVVLLFPLVSSGFARAREIARETFDNTSDAVLPTNAAGRDGKGKGLTRESPDRIVPVSAQVELPVSFDNTIKRGAISFDLQRKAGQEKVDFRSVFALKGAEGEDLLLLQISWVSEFDHRLPMMRLRSKEYFMNGLGLWSPWILLDREVLPGQWIHVDLTWDDEKGRYFLYVDGRPVDARPKSYDAGTRQILPDPRVEANRSLTMQGHSPQYFARPFGYLLAKARSIRVGANTSPKLPGRSTTPLSNAVLDNFTVLVDEFPATAGGAVVKIAFVADDSFRIPGISGKLVAGDKVGVTLAAAPGGKASFDMGDVKGIPMKELPENPGGPGIPKVEAGTYQGTYTIKPGDDFENGQIVGQFVSSDNVAAEPVLSASRWTIDTKPRVTFSIDRKDLPADSSTKARVKLVAKDANGNTLQGRRFKLTLATTDEYTGTVGAGDFGKDVGASVETRWKGETDAWGMAEFDYTAGFAAKTVILTAKDLDSGGTAVDYITAYKEASIDIALTPPVNRAAARRGLQYVLKVEATRTELTADGRSRSVIRATLLDPNGKAVAGDPVAFSLSSPNGTLRVIAGTTDSNGVATAEYIAGRKIGIVVVTATATLRNASGNASIILLSDAPAKIYLKARPESLPADGFSRADLSVKVTDINDNPNKDTKVEFRVSRGGGRLDYPDRITDRFGDTVNRYTSPSSATPGVATIIATVRSKVPTDSELAKAQNVLFAPYSDRGEDIRISRWLKKVGDTAARGEPVVEYTIGRGDTKYTLNAPYDCRIDFRCVEYWDYARTGDTLALISPVTVPGSTSPSPPPASFSPRRR